MFFIGIIVAISSQDNEQLTVNNDSALMLTLKGNLVIEKVSVDPFEQFLQEALGSEPPPLTPKNRGEKRGAGGKDIFTDSTKRQCRTSSDNYGYFVTQQKITDIEYLITNKKKRIEIQNNRIN